MDTSRKEKRDYSNKKVFKKKRDTSLESIYSRCLINRKVMLPITAIGRNLAETIEQNVRTTFEGKCIIEGFVKVNSIKIVTYSSGTIERGNIIAFEVVFECEVCFPVEGMIINCVAKNITKAGIRAESADESPSPIIVFLVKDHHYNVPYFMEVEEGQQINVRIIGQKFELNDKYISIIGELVKDKEREREKAIAKSKEIGAQKKPRLIIRDD
jgi:DNA-directed RNA polymerase subunit E'/Rpb7